MIARNMDFSPQPDDIPLVAELLADDLIEMGRDDPGKVYLALTELGRTETKWPSTALVVNKIDEFTPKAAYRIEKLPEPSEPWEVRKRKGQKMIKDVYERLQYQPPQQRMQEQKKVIADVKKLEDRMNSELGTMQISPEDLNKTQQAFVDRVFKNKPTQPER